MNLIEFKNKVIERGIAAAKADYTKPEDKNRLEGSLAGFELCRETPLEKLQQLLIEARKESNTHMFEQDLERYWHCRSKEAEIEWVCNCVSVVLANEGREPIIPCTCNAVLLANEIISEENKTNLIRKGIE